MSELPGERTEGGKNYRSGDGLVHAIDGPGLHAFHCSYRLTMCRPYHVVVDVWRTNDPVTCLACLAELG